MSSYDYMKLSNSIDGDNIVYRDFKNSNVVYRQEVMYLESEDFYRDGKNSCMDYTIQTTMFIITNTGNEYNIYKYEGGTSNVSHYSSCLKLDESLKKTNYNIPTLLLDSNIKPDLYCNLEYVYDIAKMSSIKPLIKTLKNLLAYKTNTLNEKKKIEEEARATYIKSTEFFKEVHQSIMNQLVKHSHCANCTKHEIDLSLSFPQKDLCSECIKNNVWFL